LGGECQAGHDVCFLGAIAVTGGDVGAAQVGFLALPNTFEIVAGFTEISQFFAQQFTWPDIPGFINHAGQFPCRAGNYPMLVLAGFQN
jgi:hypothetical protein